MWQDNATKFESHDHKGADSITEVFLISLPYPSIKEQTPSQKFIPPKHHFPFIQSKVKNKVLAKIMSHTNARKQHILIFPYPAQGHMLPILDLSHQLALKGLNLTILVTPKNLSNLTSLLSNHPTSIQTLILPFPPHPLLPPGVENLRELGNTGNYPVINALSKLQDPIIQWFKSHPDPPVALISDFFLGWTLDLTRHLGIPRLVFYSSRALLTSVSNYCWSNTDAVRSSKGVVEFSDIPGAPSFKAEHLPSIFLAYRKSDPDSEFVRESLLANIFSWGCVLNTLDALEGPYLEYLKRQLGHPRVFGVGPLSLIGFSDGTDRNNANLDLDSNVFKWLDGCPDGSVLYICFGSQKFLKREQMEALAAGLEKTETQFIWVVKMGSAQQVEEGYGLIPDGFEDRVVGRGLVIKGWAQQVPILNHRAVGGFLSHCGWNSVLEGTVAGVMLVAWPMEADQFVNARLLVEEMGLAVRVCEGADAVPDPVELSQILTESMSGDSPQKQRARELRDEAVKAVSPGGSSNKDLDELVKTLIQLDVKES